VTCFFFPQIALDLVTGSHEGSAQPVHYEWIVAGKFFRVSLDPMHSDNCLEVITSPKPGCIFATKHEQAPICQGVGLGCTLGAFVHVGCASLPTPWTVKDVRHHRFSEIPLIVAPKACALCRHCALTPDEHLFEPQFSIFFGMQHFLKKFFLNICNPGFSICVC